MECIECQTRMHSETVLRFVRRHGRLRAHAAPGWYCWGCGGEWVQTPSLPARPARTWPHRAMALLRAGWAAPGEPRAVTPLPV